jgi:hypothetical protein
MERELPMIYDCTRQIQHLSNVTFFTCAQDLKIEGARIDSVIPAAWPAIGRLTVTGATHLSRNRSCHFLRVIA